MIQSNENALQISLNQLVNQMNEIDYDFVQYISDDKTYIKMINLKQGATPNDYFQYEFNTVSWLQSQVIKYNITDGVFAY